MEAGFDFLELFLRVAKVGGFHQSLLLIKGFFVNSLSTGTDHDHTALYINARAGKKGNPKALSFAFAFP